MLATLLRPFTQDDLTAVAGKLEQCRQDMAAVDAELRERSLEIALLEDGAETPADIATLQARAASLRDRETLLENALAEANRREKKRLAEARSAAEKARLRAIAQHRAAAVKHAAQLGSNLAGAVEAWKKLLEASDRIEKAVRPEERTQLFGYLAVSGHLVNFVHLEVARITAHSSASRAFPFKARAILPHGVFVGDVDPIEKQVATKFDVAALYAPQPEPVPAAVVIADAEAEQEAENARQYEATYAAIRGAPSPEPVEMPAASSAQPAQSHGVAAEPQPPPEPNTAADDALARQDETEVPARVIAAKQILADVQADPDGHGHSAEAIRAAVIDLGRPW